jgi:hypothetical protein
MTATDFIFWLAVAFVIAINLYVGPRIASERIAMQWGIDGKPTWSAPKRVALWGMVAFMLAFRAVIWAASTYAPETVHGVDIAILGFSLTVAAAHVFIVMKAARSGRMS